MPGHAATLEGISDGGNGGRRSYISVSRSGMDQERRGEPVIRLWYGGDIHSLELRFPIRINKLGFAGHSGAMTGGYGGCSSVL